MPISQQLDSRLRSAVRSNEMRDEVKKALELNEQLDITITAAQMLASFTTPIALLPAPGAGLAIIVDAVYSTMDYNTTTYAVGAGETLDIKYSGGAVRVSLTEAYLESAADARQYVKSAVAASTPAVNTAVVAQMSATNPTTGNSAVKLRVYYRIVPDLL